MQRVCGGQANIAAMLDGIACWGLGWQLRGAGPRSFRGRRMRGVLAALAIPWRALRDLVATRGWIGPGRPFCIFLLVYSLLRTLIAFG